MRRTARTRRPRSGISYLEVMLAMAILTLCIVPAARMLPTLLSSQRNLENYYLLSLVAQEKLEAAVLELGADFAERDDSGDLASEGHADWRFHLLVTIPVSGAGRYAFVRSQAWLDADADTTLDPDEPQVRFDTVVANRQWSP